MSQPALIKRWSETSLILLDLGRTNEAFLMAWVSWEAYLQRVALVGLRRQGLSMADTQGVLGTSSYKDRRLSLVHGSRTVLPRLAEAGVWLIRDAVVQDEVFATGEVYHAPESRAGTSAPLGGVLRSLGPSPVPGLTPTALAAWLDGHNTKTAARS